MRNWRQGLGWAAALSACVAEAPPLATVQVNLAGGPNPGSYTARSMVPACTRDPVGEGSLGVQLSDWTGPKEGLRSLQLVIPASSATVDSAFYLGLVFGDFFAGTAYEIETRADAPRHRGQGRLKVKSGPDDWEVALTGVTSDSVAISATIACHLPDDSRVGVSRPAALRTTSGRVRR